MTFRPHPAPTNGSPPDSGSAAIHEFWYAGRFDLPTRQRFPSQSAAISGTAVAASLAFAAATAMASPTATHLPIYDALPPSYIPAATTRQPSKSRQAIALLDEWLNDHSGYDAQVWPQLKQALDEDRLSDRKLFDG